MSFLSAIALKDLSHKNLIEVNLHTFLQPSAGVQWIGCLSFATVSSHTRAHTLLPLCRNPLGQAPATKATSEAAADATSRVCVKLETRRHHQNSPTPDRSQLQFPRPGSSAHKCISSSSALTFFCSSQFSLKCVYAQESKVEKRRGLDA